MLKERIRSGILLGLAVIAGAIWLPTTAIVVILVVLCALIQSEFYRMLDAARIPNFNIVGIIGGGVLVAATAVSLMREDVGTLTGEWLVVLGFVLVVILRQFPQKHNDQPIQTVGGTMLGFFYVAYLFNFLTKLLLGWSPHDGRLLIVYMIVVVKLSDVGAYFAGCSLGRHKLVPRISPAKTWEGCLGGAVTGLIASVVFWAVSHGSLHVVSFDLVDAVLLGILLPVMGILGDLGESLFKRAAHMKDSGSMIHGMGGVFDVVDSVLFTAPVIYAYAYFFLERL